MVRKGEEEEDEGNWVTLQMMSFVGGGALVRTSDEVQASPYSCVDMLDG